MKGTTLALGAVTALALTGVVASRHGASRGSPARRSPLDYDALAADFRRFYAQVGWASDMEQELRRWARAHHVTYLGYGAQRAVFGVPGGALKIAFSMGNGDGANKNEAMVWAGAPADIRRHLVPVRADSGTKLGGGAWILMERVVARGRGALSEEAVARLTACGIGDIVGRNVSDDGRLLDYGWVARHLWRECAVPGSPTIELPPYGPVYMDEE